MLGERIDKELSLKIKNRINEFDHVYGTYDLSLHNYGPESMQGSVHVEVSDSLTANEIHNLSRLITLKIFEEFSIILTVGIYARNEKYADIRQEIEETAGKYDEVIEVHGFFVDEASKLITFDIIVDFDADRLKVKEKILAEISQKYPKFNYYIIDDYDVSD